MRKNPIISTLRCIDAINVASWKKFLNRKGESSTIRSKRPFKNVMNVNSQQSIYNRISDFTVPYFLRLQKIMPNYTHANGPYVSYDYDLYYDYAIP